MPTIAKLNVQHEYITLTVKFSPTAKVNLTTSYSGDKASGSLERAELSAVFKAFCAFIKLPEVSDGRGTVGDRMKEAYAIAQTVSTPTQLAEELIRAAHPIAPKLNLAGGFSGVNAPAKDDFAAAVNDVKKIIAANAINDVKKIIAAKNVVPVLEQQLDTLPGEKSGAYIRRLYMLGWTPEAILTAVHAHFAGSKATRSDVYWNFKKLTADGVVNVPAWKKA